MSPIGTFPQGTVYVYTYDGVLWRIWRLKMVVSRKGFPFFHSSTKSGYLFESQPYHTPLPHHRNIHTPIQKIE
jgi:hypothetical protein